jgi:hypothetical protein
LRWLQPQPTSWLNFMSTTEPEPPG